MSSGSAWTSSHGDAVVEALSLRHEARSRGDLEGVASANLRLERLFGELRRLERPGNRMAAEVASLSRLAGVFDAAPTASAAARLLRPIEIEIVRPQVEFNHALVDVLRNLANAPGSSDRRWISRRLAPLANPGAFAVRSHRGGWPALTIVAAKKTLLAAARPLIEAYLVEQAAWNESIIAALQGAKPPEELSGQANRRQLSEAAPKVLQQVLRSQERFNESVLRFLSRLRASELALSARASEKRRRQPVQELRKESPPLSITVYVSGQNRLPEYNEPQVEVRRWNGGVRESHSELAVFIGDGDVLFPEAFAHYRHAAIEHPSSIVFYCNEELIERDGVSTPFFKPRLSSRLLLSADVASRGVAIRESWLREQRTFDSAYAMTLAASLQGQPFHHLDQVLVSHTEGSSGVSAYLPNNAARTVAQALGERAAGIGQTPTSVRARFRFPDNQFVSIIVPFRDKPELLDQLLRSFKQTRYPHYELLLISNNSQRRETRELLERARSETVRVFEWNHPFNYSAINNFGATQARGNVLLFLNNDVEITDSEWLATLLGELASPNVAAVGPKLIYPDNTIQHAGVVVGMQRLAGHPFAGLPNDGSMTPMGSADWSREVLAVTGACLMMSRQTFDLLGGFDEAFEVCGSDVDLCLRARAQGGATVYTASTTLIHHESATRSTSPVLEADILESIRSYWPWLGADPFFSRWLSLNSTEPHARLDIGATELGAQAEARRAALEALPLGQVRSLSPRLERVRNEQRLVQQMALPEGARARRRALGRAAKSLTWFLPSFAHPFGGVHTIFRFANLWRDLQGVESRFIIYDDPGVSEREIRARAAPISELAPGSVHIIRNQDELSALPHSELAIATHWTSVASALRHPHAAEVLYFVQDDESRFSSAGIASAMANRTYELGLFGLFNSKGVHDAITTRTSMRGVYFEPSVDRETFYPPAAPRREGVRVFFYARPSVERNAFALGIEALRNLKKLHGSKIEIVVAGEEFDPADFDADDVITNLGVLPYGETAELYRTVDIGLVFMMTEHPSYLPLELMACGVAVVSNRNAANLWLLRDQENCVLAEPGLVEVTHALDMLVRDAELRARLGGAGLARVQATTWSAEGATLWAKLTHHLQG